MNLIEGLHEVQRIGPSVATGIRGSLIHVAVILRSLGVLAVKGSSCLYIIVVDTEVGLEAQPVGDIHIDISRTDQTQQTLLLVKIFGD